MRNFPLISISGSATQRGLEYGKQAAPQIHNSLKLYKGSLQKLCISKGDLADLVGKFLPLIQSFDAENIEEMRAIASGADVSFEEIVLINARTEIMSLANRKFNAQELSDDGCTGAVILPERHSEGLLLHGQNWDWLPECANSSIVLQVQPDSGPGFLTFTEAGGLARNGFNDHGIAITANYLECERDFSQSGVPLALIRRKVLRQSHLAEALRLVSVTPKSASNNMIISHKDGYAQSLECAPDETFNIWPENGVLVHSNHWLSQIALSKFKEQSAKNWADSYYRDWRVKKILSDAICLNMDHFKAAFLDDFGAPLSVCRSPSNLAGGKTMATVATIVMNPSEGFMEVARNPYEGAHFQRYEISMSTWSGSSKSISEQRTSELL